METIARVVFVRVTKHLNVCSESYYKIRHKLFNAMLISNVSFSWTKTLRRVMQASVLGNGGLGMGSLLKLNTFISLCTVFFYVAIHLHIFPLLCSKKYINSICVSLLYMTFINKFILLTEYNIGGTISYPVKSFCKNKSELVSSKWN